MPAGDWLHWTGNAQNWNTTCADCHSANLKKNYDIEKDAYHTTYSSVNASCEACHGAGRNRIDYINNKEFKEGNKITLSMLQLPKNAGQITQINTCAPCHVLKTSLSKDQLLSAELLDNYIPDVPSTERFHANGQVNEEDFIYTSFCKVKCSVPASNAATTIIRIQAS